MGKNMLERLGYHVTVRKSSLEALGIFWNQPDQFDVVITDQTMPNMTGVDLARRMLQIRPDIPHYSLHRLLEYFLGGKS